MERAHYLVVVEGPNPGERMRLGPKPVVIGRKEPAEWLLADPRVSRLHCRVWLSVDEVMVTDLDSTNGTYIDGKLAAGGAVPLPPGSRLEIGSHILVHEWNPRKDSQKVGG